MGTGRRPDPAELPPEKGTERWGGVARRGAARLDEDSASAAWRQAGDDARRSREAAEDAAANPRSEPAWQPEEWIDEGTVRDEASEAVGRGRWTPAPLDLDDLDPADADDVARHQRDSDVDAEVRKAVGAARAPRFEQRLREAGDAFRRGRYDEARRISRPLSETAPQLSAVRELYGLSLYRLGRWKAAARELEAFRTLTSSVEQHPVLADCYRALKRYGDVEELWNELSAASPGAALVAEGRIVAAGALADQGRVDDAIRLLQPGIKPTRKAKEYHLRVAYALADLYERAGDSPQARELFQRIASTNPDFVDVEARLHALR